ncbi:MAG: hypothetical protein U1B79_01870 [Candidatus Pacearchaeota archaeon]|nr:hypothetical protein [Nanoarchaeota archaeon]MDZ4226833.1 hypothetical protein [Candidatus Pacearchaeota archaeon]
MGYTIISGKDFNEARKKIRENKGREIVFTSDDDELNRKVLEKESINVLLINQKGRKDKVKQRDSGFNQVLAKLAKKKSVSVGINLDEIMKTKEEEKAEILARIRQNVKLCNKNKLKVRFISKESNEAGDWYNLKALGLVLGMPTWMVKSI